MNVYDKPPELHDGLRLHQRRTGGQTDRPVDAAAARGVYLRDRGTEAGCEGCIRITAGIVEHTRRGLAVLEEVVCAAR
jgi:histidinol-phosphate/aromatic aminotransferase/cobyric acid decarboxylase-like protein